MIGAVHPLELEGPFIGQFTHAKVATYLIQDGKIGGAVALYGENTSYPMLITLDRYRKSVIQNRILTLAEYDAQH